MSTITHDTSGSNSGNMGTSSDLVTAGGDLAALLRTLERLPLSDVERAEAVRRLLYPA